VTIVFLKIFQLRYTFEQAAASSQIWTFFNLCKVVNGQLRCYRD